MSFYQKTCNYNNGNVIFQVNRWCQYELCTLPVYAGRNYMQPHQPDSYMYISTMVNQQHAPSRLHTGRNIQTLQPDFYILTIGSMQHAPSQLYAGMNMHPPQSNSYSLMMDHPSVMDEGTCNLYCLIQTFQR